MRAPEPQMGTRSRRNARALPAPPAKRGAPPACPLRTSSLPAFQISELVHSDFRAANVYSFQWAGALTPAFDYSWLSTRTRKDDHG